MSPHFCYSVGLECSDAGPCRGTDCIHACTHRLMSIPYVNMIIMTGEQSFALLYIPDLFIAAYKP